MKTIIYAFLFLFPSFVFALNDDRHLSIIATTSVRSMIAGYAVVYGVDVDLALYVAAGESNFDEKTVGDMNIICKRTSRPVRARGVWQITECYWPEISDEQAFSAEWSTQWAMSSLMDKKKCIQTWTVCAKYYAIDK